MSLHQKEKIKANMSLIIVETGKQKADNPLKELKETLWRLEKHNQELEKKVRAQNQKAQQFTAAVETEKALRITKAVKLYALKKCMEKKKRLEKKIYTLRNFNFCIENQITLLEGRAKIEIKPVYDESPINEKSAVKSMDMDHMEMNDDELRETIHEINKDIEYIQLKSSPKLGRRCQHVLSKPFISMKTNLCKLFRNDKVTSKGQNTATALPSS